MPSQPGSASEGAVTASLLGTRVSLVVTFVTAAFTVQYFARTNDLFASMKAHQPLRKLPGGLHAYSPEFTGIKQLDWVASYILMFFWTIISGDNPGLTLAAAPFAGAGVGVWVLTMVEGLRSGNKWRAISFTGFYGMAGQLFGIGVVAPLYLLLQTYTSPTVLRPSHSTVSPSSTASIGAIPAAITVGFIVPTVLMCLNTTIVPLNIKLQMHNLWQIFPITCSLSHLILSVIWPFNPSPTPQNTMKYLRTAYKFALVCTAPMHVAAWAISISAYLFPTIFASGVVADLLPKHVFLPSNAPFLGVKASSIAEGGLWFIQWDYVTVSAAYLVWAIAMRQSARRAVQDPEPFGLLGAVKVGTRTTVLGPIGAAIVYIWERDELVLGGKAEEAALKKVL